MQCVGVDLRSQEVVDFFNSAEQVKPCNVGLLQQVEDSE
jgi:hypothetical protein